MLDGRFVDINRAGPALFAQDEMRASNVAKLYADPADRLTIKEDIRQLGILKDYEVTLVRKDGIQLYCLITLSIWCDTGGDPVGYQGIIRDVTMQRTLSLLMFARLQDATSLIEPVDTDAVISSTLIRLEQPIQTRRGVG